MHGLTVYVKERLPFARDLPLENSADSNLCSQMALLHSLSYFFFVYWSLSSSLCTVFDSTLSNMMRFSRSTHLLMFLSLQTSTTIIKTDLPIPVELIYLVNSVIIFLSQSILLTWLTFLLTYQAVILTVLLFWIYLFLLTLAFVLQWLSLHWKILIMLLSQFPYTFHHIHNGMPCFIALLITILMLIRMIFVIIWEMLHGRISLHSVLLLLLVNFVSAFSLELMYIFFTEITRSSLTHFHGFRLLVLLPQLIEITFFVFTKRMNLLNLK